MAKFEVGPNRPESFALGPFPGTRPKPDEMKTWIDAFEDAAAARGLGPVANGEAPERVAYKALSKYPAEELALYGQPDAGKIWYRTLREKARARLNHGGPPPPPPPTRMWCQ